MGATLEEAIHERRTRGKKRKLDVSHGRPINGHAKPLAQGGPELVEQLAESARHHAPADVEPRGESEDPWYDKGSTWSATPKELFEAAAVNSCDTLAQKPSNGARKIRGTFDFLGKQWVSVGSLSGGIGKEPEWVDLICLIPRDQWKGRPATGLENEHRRKHLYYALEVQCRGKKFVIGEERIHLVREGEVRTERGSRATTPAAAPQLDPPAADVAALLWIKTKEIDPHPENPRIDFDEQELKKLGQSMRDNGQLQNVIVRRQGSRFELLGGERRWRAAKVAGLHQVLAKVLEVDDARALEILIVENVERKDLNPIERARGLVSLTKPREEGGGGKTQAEAAALFGHGQAWAANTLRLLKLPEKIRAKIISGEIAESAARDLLPLCEDPRAAAIVEKILLKQKALGELSREQIVDQASFGLRRAARSMTKLGYYGDREFDADAATETKLQVIEIPDPYRRGKTERIALNAKLWDTLQKKARETKSQEAKKAAKKPAKKKKLTPVQQLELAAKRRKQHAKQLAAWRQRALRMLMAEQLVQSKDAVQEKECAAFRIVLWLLAGGGGNYAGVRDPHRFAETAIRSSGGQTKRSGLSGGVATAWTDAQSVPLLKLGECLVLTAAAVLDGTPHWHDLPDALVDHVAGEMGITVENAWFHAQRSIRQKQWAEQFAAFFDLHNKEQLTALAKELGVNVLRATSKQHLMRCFTGAPESGRSLALPQCLDGGKKGRGRPAKKKGKVKK